MNRSSFLPTCLAALLLSPPAAAQFLFGRLVPPLPATEGNGPTETPQVSADGKVFVFSSSATNWVAGSITGAKIISVDLAQGSVANLSTTAANVAFNASSFGPSTSRDGRYTVFNTLANNLGFAMPTSGFQVVRKDRSTGALALASASALGVPALGSAAGQARDASVSSDGRFVAFRSDASNLVGSDVQGEDDVFVKDLASGAIEAITLDTSGAFTGVDALALSANAISGDGRYVAFVSSAANLAAGVAGGIILVYVRDRDTDTSVVVSRATGGALATNQSDVASISPSGRLVSFRSFATNLVAGASGSRVYTHDRVSGVTSVIPLPSVNAVAASGCRESDIADNGVVILTCFFGSGLFDQVFLHVPGAAGTPFLISSDANDVAGNQQSGVGVGINASGLSMTFDSRASNLEAGDLNGVSDAFVLIDEAILDGIFADGFE